MSGGVELFTVYSYGGGEAIYYMFNAIAMLFRSELIGSLMNLSLALGLIWAGLKSGIERDHHRPYVKWLMTYLFVVMVLMPGGSGQKMHGMTMYIRDTITGSAKKVDNLPPGLVIPAALISNIGYSITKSFETVFSLPSGNYLKYHEYGTMFGAEVMSELANFRIQNPVLRENLESYVNNCIMYDVMIGHSYDISDLKNSTDIETLITGHASSIRMFNYRKDKGRELLTCKDGIRSLTGALLAEQEVLSSKFPALSLAASKQSSLSQQQKAEVKFGILNALSAAKTFYKPFDNQTGEQQLKQILLINAFKLHPNSYGTVRAAQSQNSTWKLTGEMAKQTLPIIHALFQALIYGAFPIIMCLMFFPGGFKALLSYFGMMMWIELWAPLFAILNLIVSVFAANSGVTDITIQNLDSIVSSQSNYALAAASLSMLVPVLSYMIVKGGAGQFVHIAGSLQSATNQGVGSASSEVVSGNRSLDNVSIANDSRNITSANKHDTSSYIDAGSIVKERQPDGAFKTDLGNGKLVYDTTGMSSTGHTSLSMSRSTRDSMQKAWQDQHSVHKSLTNEYGRTIQSLDRHTVDFLSTIARNRHKGKQYSVDTSTEEGKSLMEHLNKIEELHDKYDYTYQQAAELVLNSSIGVSGGGGGGSDSRGNGKVDASAIISGRASAMEQNVQAVGDGTSVSSSQQVDDRRALHNKWTEVINYSENDSEEKRLGDSISQTFETANSLRKSLNQSATKLEQFSNSISRSEDIGSQYSIKQYDEVLKHIAESPDKNFPSLSTGYPKAIRIVESGGKEFQQHWEDYQKQHNLPQSDKIGKFLSNEEAQLSKKTDFDVKKIQEEFTPVDNTAQFKKEQQEQNLPNFNVEGTDIKAAVADQLDKTTGEIDSAETKIKAEQKKLEQERDKADNAGSVIGKIFARTNPKVKQKGLLNKTASNISEFLKGREHPPESKSKK